MLRVRIFLCALPFLFGSLPLFGQTTDNGIHVPPGYNTFQPPAVGSSYVDPVFNTPIKRISDVTSHVDATNGKAISYVTHEYSSMSPFNCDDSLLLLTYQSYFVLNDGDGNYIRPLPFVINAGSEPRWSRTDPNVLYFVSGNKLEQYNVGANSISVIHTFSEFSRISGKGESDLSEDGDHLVFAGDDRFVFVFELSTGIKSPAFNTGQSFDGLQISPNNNVTISWFSPGTARSQGIELFDRNMNFLRQVARADGHMDLTRDTNGDEVMVWTNSADPVSACANAIVKVRLADASQTCLLSLPWTLAVDISAPAGNGWAYVSTYDPANSDPAQRWDAFENEIFQVRLDGTGYRRLLHHRSRPADTYNYQPRASVSRDGKKLVYASNYDLQSILGSIFDGLLGLLFTLPPVYTDEYLIQLSNEPLRMSSLPAAGASGTLAAFSQTMGTAPNIDAGYVHISPAAGRTVAAGLEVLSYRKSGILISETSTAASHPVSSGFVYAETASPVDTYLTIVNPNDTNAVIDFFAVDQDGRQFGSGEISVGPHNQVSQHLSQAPLNIPAGLIGTVEFSSTPPVVVTAYRSKLNERSELLIDSLPIFQTGKLPTVNPVALPHYANGGGWTTEIVLCNPSTQRATGRLDFIADGGAAAIPSQAFDIPPGGLRRFQTDGITGPVPGGWMRLTAFSGYSMPLALTLFSYRSQGVEIGESSDVPASPSTTLRLFAELTNRPNGSLQSETGVAIANSSSNDVIVNLSLLSVNGVNSGIQSSFLIPAGGHFSTLLSVLPGFARIPTPFAGFLKIDASGPVAALAIRFDLNERGEIVFSTVPGLSGDPVPDNSGSSWWFSGYEDSGGFNSAFVVFGGENRPGPPATMDFFNSAGNPVALPVQ